MVRYGSSSGATNLTVPQNEWHHFAITRAANTATVTTYWDGQILSSDQSADGAGTTALLNLAEIPSLNFHVHTSHLKVAGKYLLE